MQMLWDTVEQRDNSYGNRLTAAIVEEGERVSKVDVQKAKQKNQTNKECQYVSAAEEPVKITQRGLQHQV